MCVHKNIQKILAKSISIKLRTKMGIIKGHYPECQVLSSCELKNTRLFWLSTKILNQTKRWLKVFLQVRNMETDTFNLCMHLQSEI